MVTIHSLALLYSVVETIRYSAPSSRCVVEIPIPIPRPCIGPLLTAQNDCNMLSFGYCYGPMSLLIGSNRAAELVEVNMPTEHYR